MSILGGIGTVAEDLGRKIPVTQKSEIERHRAAFVSSKAADSGAWKTMYSASWRQRVP